MNVAAIIKHRNSVGRQETTFHVSDAPDWPHVFSRVGEYLARYAAGYVGEIERVDFKEITTPRGMEE